MEPTTDAPEVLETPAPETTPDPVEPAEPQADEKDQKIAELEEKNKQLFERAKKAEGKAKEAPPPASAPAEPRLSERDVIALSKADIADEDIDEVLEYARFKKISVSEALKAPVMTQILADKKEQRQPAQATQTTRSSRGSAKVNPEEILAKAERTGELPDTDEGMKALVEARLARRFKKSK